MRSWRKIFVPGFLLAIACAEDVGATQDEPIHYVSAEDTEMNAAKVRAIATLPEFYAHLAHPARDETEFMVKFDIVPDERVEYVWATDLDRSTSPMTGVLSNQPVMTSDRIDQRVSIPESSIIDWMYRRGRVMQGGFTARVLLERMTPEEAAPEREYLGW